MKKDESITGIILLLFGGITVILSVQMPVGTFRMPGSGLFPLCLGILLMGLASIFLLNLHLRRQSTVARKEQVEASAGSIWQVILFMGAMVLATLFFNPLGYPLVSFLLLLSLLRILGMKKWGPNFLISILTSLGSYFLFVQWLQIPLPKGWIGF